MTTQAKPESENYQATSAGLLWLCRDHVELRDLSQLLVALCEQGARRSVIDSCAGLLRERIEEHERDEETFLHGRMMQRAEGLEPNDEVLAQIRKVLQWHDRIDSDVFALARIVDDENAALGVIGETAQRLQRELTRHFDYEEKIFFPLADKILDVHDEESLRDELRAALLVRLDQMTRELETHHKRPKQEA